MVIACLAILVRRRRLLRRLNGLRSLTVAVPFLAGTLALVAGGCDPHEQERMEGYAQLLRDGFRLMSARFCLLSKVGCNASAGCCFFCSATRGGHCC